MPKRLDLSRTTLLRTAVYKLPGEKRKAARVVTFVMEWRAVRDELGHDPTIAEFIAATGWAERTVFNRLSEFRQVFDAAPGLTPNDVLRAHDAAEFESLAAYPATA
jgi:hypothetical protein